MDELLETLEDDLLYSFQYFFFRNCKTPYFLKKILGSLEMLCNHSPKAGHAKQTELFYTNVKIKKIYDNITLIHLVLMGSLNRCDRILFRLHGLAK